MCHLQRSSFVACVFGARCSALLVTPCVTAKRREYISLDGNCALVSSLVGRIAVYLNVALHVLSGTRRTLRLMVLGLLRCVDLSNGLFATMQVIRNGCTRTQSSTTESGTERAVWNRNFCHV